MKLSGSQHSSKRRTKNQTKLAKQQSRTAPEKTPVNLEGLEIIHRHAAGIDVGSAENYVCIPASSVKEGESAVRVFGVFSAEQDATVEWLHSHGITTVAMEATGIYWLSLYDKLEARGIQVLLVDTHAVKAVPGRKSDRLDCQWIQKLHSHGLLQSAFRPEQWIRRLRTLTRHRHELIECGVAHQEHMHKALVCMNLHLGLVVSDIVGETGLRILDAILVGNRDPKELVKLRDPRCCKSTIKEMEDALKGSYQDEWLLVLRQSLEAWRFYQQQLEAVDQELMKLMKLMPAAPAATQAPPPKPVAVEEPQASGTKRKKKDPCKGKNALTLDFTAELLRVCGVNLLNMVGCNTLCILMLIGEIGVDMSKWRNAKAFASWLGLCPATKISGGRVLSRRTRKVQNRASAIFRMMAWAAGKSDSWLGHFYRRVAAKKGPAKAVTATARKIACIVYHMLKYRDAFVFLDPEKYRAQAQKHRMRRLEREAKALGYRIVEEQEVA